MMGPSRASTCRASSRSTPRYDPSCQGCRTTRSCRCKSAHATCGRRSRTPPRATAGTWNLALPCPSPPQSHDWNLRPLRQSVRTRPFHPLQEANWRVCPRPSSSAGPPSPSTRQRRHPHTSGTKDGQGRQRRCPCRGQPRGSLQTHGGRRKNGWGSRPT